MIWQGRRKLGLISILAFFLFSCEEPGEIGLELNPDKNKVGLFYKELILPTSVINTDSLETDFSDRLLAGRYFDNNFGEMTCTSITQVRQDFGFPVFSADDVFDSLVFMFDVDYTYGPDIGYWQKYYLHQLEEQLTDTISYYAKRDIKYSDQPLGENEFFIDPVIDTVLTIKLNDEFGQEFFNTITDTSKIDWLDIDSFIEYFRGLALVPDNGNNTVVGFAASADSSILKLYYHGDNDTSSYNFILDNVVNFNQILSDKSGSTLEQIEDQYYKEFIPSDERSYLQAGTGVVFKIDMTPFTDFVDTIPNLIVNSSAIEISIAPSLYNVNPPNYLHLYFTDSTNRRIQSGLVYLGVLTGGTSDLLAMPYESEDLIGYNGVITTYTEDIIRGVHDFTHLLVYPSEFELTQSVNLMVTKQGGVKLKIYYTALK